MNLFEKLKNNLISSAGNVNRTAADKDSNRNRVNYGCASAYASVLRELGNEIDIACWEDSGYLKIEKIVFDGDVINFNAERTEK